MTARHAAGHATPRAAHSDPAPDGRGDLPATDPRTGTPRDEGPRSVGPLRADVRLDRGRLHLDASVTVAPGEAVALIGPNGAGKTTLLHAVAGLVALAGGRVSLDGTVWEDVATGVRLPAERRSTGLVFSDARLLPHLRCVDDVAFGLRAARLPRREARRRASEALQAVGVPELARARTGRLSAGQRQRVALARALARRPHVLLLDEALAAVDAAGRPPLRALAATFEGPLLLASHDAVEVGELADRVLVIEEGRVTAAGPTREVLSRPRTPWSATFAGLVLFAGRAEGGRVDVAGVRLPAPTHLAGAVHVALDPRALVVAAPEDELPDALPGWCAAVARVTNAGARAIVEFEAPLAVAVEVPLGRVPAVGDLRRLGVPPGAVAVYP